MTINGLTLKLKGRKIISYLEDHITDEVRIIFNNGTYAQIHGTWIEEGMLHPNLYTA